VIAPLSTPRAIIFDWDNTLVDTFPCIHAAMTATFEAMGQTPWTFEEFKRNLGPSMRDCFPQMFGARWEEAGEVFHRAFAEKHLQTLTAFPGAEELLARLKAGGVYLGVVSNKTGKHLRAEADHLGWRDYFGEMVGANDAAQDKPAADPVHKALNGSGVTAGPEVWLVGDSRMDLLCATNAGCVPILLRQTPPAEDEFIDCRPRHHITDFPSLSAILTQLAVPMGKI